MRPTRPTRFTLPPHATRASRLLARLRWPIRVTREGKYFLALTLAVGVAAINTGNNLLYLLLGALLSLIVTSGVLSELSLRGLTVTRHLPRRAQVARSHLVEIEVSNRKPRFPSYAIEVEDLRAHQPADKRCFFLKISPSSQQIAAYKRTPARRGIDRHTGFRIATRFPFGFFEKSRIVTAPEDLLIYPAVDPVRLPPSPIGHHMGNVPGLGRGHGDEILGLRPLHEGDDPRDIYWRRSTHPDQMVLRERAREVRPDVQLHLDLRPDGSPPFPQFHQHLEHRIRDLASRAVAHLKQRNTVVLRTSAGDCLRVTPTQGADSLLTFLALVEPQVPADSSPPPTPWALVPTASIPPAFSVLPNEPEPGPS